MTETTTTKKLPENIKIKYKKIKVPRNEYFVLEVTISKEFQDILKDCSLPETEQEIAYDEFNPDLKRYKAFKWIFPELGDGKDYLFVKELVDTGKLILNFADVTRVERFVSNFNYNATKTTQTYLKNNDFELNVAININKPNGN
jgi:hypothetical protein